jgi:hypothetical protein
VKLRTLLKRGIERLDYLYDMGDNWHHVITIEGVEDGVSDTKYPRYVRGAGRAPPEDVGGTDGFKHFLEAIADPRHRDHKEMMERHRECYGIDYDPETLDEFAIKLGIGAIAKRRAAGKAAASKRK